MTKRGATVEERLEDILDRFERAVNRLERIGPPPGVADNSDLGGYTHGGHTTTGDRDDEGGR